MVVFGWSSGGCGQVCFQIGFLEVFFFMIYNRKRQRSNQSKDITFIYQIRLRCELNINFMVLLNGRYTCWSDYHPLTYLIHDCIFFLHLIHSALCIASRIPSQFRCSFRIHMVNATSSLSSFFVHGLKEATLAPTQLIISLPKLWIFLSLTPVLHLPKVQCNGSILISQPSLWCFIICFRCLWVFLFGILLLSSLKTQRIIKQSLNLGFYFHTLIIEFAITICVHPLRSQCQVLSCHFSAPFACAWSLLGGSHSLYLGHLWILLRYIKILNVYLYCTLLLLRRPWWTLL